MEDFATNQIYLQKYGNDMGLADLYSHTAEKEVFPFIGVDSTMNILRQLEDRDLFHICQMKNHFLSGVCSNEEFWKRRTLEKYPTLSTLEEKEIGSWKKFYIRLGEQLRFLKHAKILQDVNAMFLWASAHGYLELLKYILSVVVHKYPKALSKNTKYIVARSMASQYNHKHVVQWLDTLRDTDQ